MATKTLLLACVLILGMCIIANGMPTAATQAFCKIAWLVGLPCAQVNMAIVSQMKAMGTYKLGAASPALIQANHTSAVGQIQNVTFTMLPAAMGLGCRVEGSSISAMWFILFDNGTNYCNLHDLMKGSGLTKAPGFLEFTSEWICPGAGMSPCKK